MASGAGEDRGIGDAESEGQMGFLRSKPPEDLKPKEQSCPCSSFHQNANTLIGLWSTLAGESWWKHHSYCSAPPSMETLTNLAEKVEGELRKEQRENKRLQIHISALEGDIKILTKALLQDLHQTSTEART